MKVAFDIDGTITSQPAVFQHLMYVLRNSDEMKCEVLVLTSKKCGKDNCFVNANDFKFRFSQLEKFDIRQHVHYDTLMIATGVDDVEIGASKAKLLRELEVDVFIDDNVTFLALAKRTHPKLLCLKIF